MSGRKTRLSRGKQERIDGNKEGAEHRGRATGFSEYEVMGKEKREPNAEGARANIILWLDDDAKFLRRLEETLRIPMVQIFTVSSDEMPKVVKYLTGRSAHEAILVGCIVRGRGDTESMVNAIERLRPRGVISDLEMAGNSLSGLSLLAGVGRADPRCFRGLVTGHMDESVASLSQSMGLDLIANKEDIPKIQGALMQVWGLDDGGGDVRTQFDELQRQYNALERRMRANESKNEELTRERNRLRRKVREIRTQKVPSPKKKRGKKEEDSERAQLLRRAEAAEQRVQIVLGHQHDLQSLAEAVTATIGNVCVQPQLLPPVIKDKLEEAWTAAKHSSVLIGSTLDIAADKKPSKKATGSIPGSFEEAQRIMAGQMAERIAVHIALPDEMRVANIPDKLIVRCALNLFMNSRDAIEGRGRIEVATKARPSARAKHVEVVVRDNGRGIKKRDLPRIFDWGFTTKGSRYGMGLFIVKRIMERYGGEVRIVSARGKGTSVTLRIPVG